VREAVRAVSGRTPSAAAMDALLDERLSHRVQGQSPPGHRADSRGTVALQACLDELGIVAERRREPPADDHHAHVIRAGVVECEEPRTASVIPSSRCRRGRERARLSGCVSGRPRTGRRRRCACSSLPAPAPVRGRRETRRYGVRIGPGLSRAGVLVIDVVGMVVASRIRSSAIIRAACGGPDPVEVLRGFA
jgi:hypothetical protein